MASLESEFAAQALELIRLRAELEEMRTRLRGVAVAERTVWRSLGVPLRDVPHLDRPHQDRIVRRYRLFESADEGFRADTRLYLDRPALLRLTELATTSATGRVAIHGCVVEVEDRQTNTGQSYRVMRFAGVPEPEWR